MDEIKNLCNDNNFKSEKYIKEYFKDKVNLDRTLRVGIVGRVKSGKSSLLNSLLFDGKDILPKAATPMTAALTNIQYSDTNYIEIEFLTKKDIEGLEKIYNSYNNALEKEKKNLINSRTISERAISVVGTSVSNVMTASNKFKSKDKIVRNDTTPETYYDYDKFEKDAKEIVDKNEYLKNGKEKYDLIKKANELVYNHVLEQEKERIDFKNIEEISDKLKDYVGTEGKFVDFVKSLNIYINIDYLKDLNILDTPGFNDPVGTRDAKARELLSKCDVVLILMPATQLFTESDRDIISKIRKKKEFKRYML
ncbi:dynamin family protein [Brachyspira aalborgi]|uniref:dynamin family protein n=1 Tax=Brachyspira aalborgi TaxID=29522 RepID=UPI00131564AE|nr:dynamin family protein [Brachyspira aalborgi]